MVTYLLRKWPRENCTRAQKNCSEQLYPLDLKLYPPDLKLYPLDLKLYPLDLKLGSKIVRVLAFKIYFILYLTCVQIKKILFY